MGMKLNFLFGRTFKTSKFKSLAKLAISRIALLNKQHNVRSSQARSDVLQLLNLGHHQRALLRVEYVIKEQNLLDLFSMIESYCQLLIQRVKLIQNKECPDELKEAISSLLFAASRCGEFPELQAIRKVLESWFGKVPVARAAELCSPKILQKFSARQSSIESRMKILEEIAFENDITLHLEDDIYIINEAVRQKQQIEHEPNITNTKDIYELKDDTWDLPNIKLQETLSESTKARKEYKDATAAAEAFQSATYAAAAAIAAMELSLSESQNYVTDTDTGDDNSLNGQNEFLAKSEEWSKSEISIVDEKEEQILSFDKIHHTDTFSYHLEVEETVPKESEKGNKVGNIINNGSDDDENRKKNIPLFDSDLDLDTSTSFCRNEHSEIKHVGTAHEDISNKDGDENDNINHSLGPLKFQVDHMTHYSMGRSMSDSLTTVKQLSSHHSNLDRKPVSVRTRRLYSNVK